MRRKEGSASSTANQRGGPLVRAERRKTGARESLDGEEARPESSGRWNSRSDEHEANKKGHSSVERRAAKFSASACSWFSPVGAPDTRSPSPDSTTHVRVRDDETSTTVTGRDSAVVSSPLTDRRPSAGQGGARACRPMESPGAVVLPALTDAAAPRPGVDDASLCDDAVFEEDQIVPDCSLPALPTLKSDCMLQDVAPPPTAEPRWKAQGRLLYRCFCLPSEAAAAAAFFAPRQDLSPSPRFYYPSLYSASFTAGMKRTDAEEQPRSLQANTTLTTSGRARTTLLGRHPGTETPPGRADIGKKKMFRAGRKVKKYCGGLAVRVKKGIAECRQLCRPCKASPRQMAASARRARAPDPSPARRGRHSSRGHSPVLTSEVRSQAAARKGFVPRRDLERTAVPPSSVQRLCWPTASHTAGLWAAPSLLAARRIQTSQCKPNEEFGRGFTAPSPLVGAGGKPRFWRKPANVDAHNEAIGHKKRQMGTRAHAWRCFSEGAFRMAQVTAASPRVEEQPFEVLYTVHSSAPISNYQRRPRRE
ncbi:hypothetical protein HPB48_016243 [Haemaphysalis longicornis]|uniref:Uncharacterized protein n=1 Tax=Haemaphysalis longicornis TaxID=44386 RepID=A0A9J6GEZ0_HAELO|nr:hypothetical protein HPB48_016243 [Haemaphysalis longicornis]